MNSSQNAAKLDVDLEDETLTAFGIDDQQLPSSQPPSKHKSNSEKPSPESSLNRVLNEYHEVFDDTEGDAGTMTRLGIAQLFAFKESSLFSLSVVGSNQWQRASHEMRP